MELILKAKTEILSNNLEEFQAEAKNILSQINLDLKDDNDFLVAAQSIKDISTIEKNIKLTLDDLLNGNKDLSQIIDSVTNISDEFRQKRLNLEKKVKSRKEEIKNELKANFTQQAERLLDNKEYKSSYEFKAKQEIQQKANDCVKNKRNIEAINISFAEALEELKLRFNELEEQAEREFKLRAEKLAAEEKLKEQQTKEAAERQAKEATEKEKQTFEENASQEDEEKEKPSLLQKVLATLPEPEITEQKADNDELPPQWTETPQKTDTYLVIVSLDNLDLAKSLAKDLKESWLNVRLIKEES